MRILQISNIVSHHQLPLARSFAALVGTKCFRFAVTQGIIQERAQMGWNVKCAEEWVLLAGENNTHREEFEHWWNTADVVICGERLFSRMESRLASDKLTFYMSERWWKPPLGRMRLLHPRFANMALRFNRLSRSPWFYYLPMGEYAAGDMRTIAQFTGRMRRWGYFTEPPDRRPINGETDRGVSVLWVGRMLGWKRAGTLIKGISLLARENPKAILTLVGEGPEKQSLERLARRWLSPRNYQFLPFRPASEIIELMRGHNIYVLPSNGREGWGAVVNEAMSCGCVVVASEMAGAAKTMIRHGDNGLLFRPGDWRMLGELLKEVSANPVWRLQMAEKAERTINELWSPGVAADRFLSVSDAILTGLPIPEYNDGPLSPA